MAGPAFAGTPKKPGDPLVAELRHQLKQRNSAEFRTLLNRWEKDLGVRAVAPLLQIASDTAVSDPERYIALMGSAKIGGRAVAAKVVPFLSDSSWMLRNGALRALATLGQPGSGQHVLKLLRDPALVVRLEAVSAIDRLRPKDAAPALIAAIHDKANYHADKAQWVPVRALDVLGDIGDKAVLKQLAPLLDRHQDPTLLKKTVETFEKVTGKKLAAGKPLREQATAWKKVGPNFW